ncbi:MAG: hypothetical protein MZV70_12170 [Desulfobacterales bacterium]|nr:hypothetical protein [Desulfobacterales bacterium]
MTLGHEISGNGGGGRARRGDAGWARPVIVPAVMPCGELRCLPAAASATSAARRKCPDNDIQGGFATHIVVPAAQLCEVPAG